MCVCVRFQDMFFLHITGVLDWSWIVFMLIEGLICSDTHVMHIYVYYFVTPVCELHTCHFVSLPVCTAICEISKQGIF